MSRNVQRYIVEINGFEGSEVSVFIKTQTGNHCLRTTRLCWSMRRAHRLLTRVIVPLQKQKKHGQRQWSPGEIILRHPLQTNAQFRVRWDLRNCHSN
jgi:hypothetical protein